ncbi:hypothetical protein JM47_02345 [Ureaplasma diversum]|uniref:Lipoprotein n=1 Tax=Ureaplasma diversum TaxID=42094 RepID=A0A0C5RC13_9BACT|nr:hypothetical protein [Ureaplasma diversum]AJQ45406.1 hypothetical protein JM47_02345 [Ureaplasma diversum]
MKLIKNNKFKKYSSLIIVPIVGSAISLIAVACNKTAPENYTKEFFKPSLVYNNEIFKPNEMTADEAAGLITINSDGTSNFVSLNDQKPEAVYKITKINKNGLHLEINYVIELAEYKLKYEYVTYHGPYLTSAQKDIFEAKKANNESLMKALELNEKEKHNFLGIKIKPEYKDLTIDQMKAKGDQLITFSKDDPDYLHKNNPAYSGINIKLVDIIKYEDFNQNDPDTLIFNLEVSKGENESKVIYNKSVVIKLNKNNRN